LTMEQSSESPEAPNIDYRCPQCGDVFAQYRIRCPACGAPIDQAFSGRYHPRRGRATRLFAWVIIVMFVLSVALGVILAAWSLWWR